MKRKIPILLLLSALYGSTHAQMAVGGSTTPDSTRAIVDINATNKGVLVPRMTTAQRTGIVTPAGGLLVYDLTTTTFWYYDGSTWIELIDRSNLEPVGMIAAFATATLPAGWLALNGQTVTVAAYPSLATSNPGFVSGANIVLPDYRGLFLRGNGTNADAIGTAAPANTGIVSTFTTAQAANPITTSAAGNHTHTGTTNTTGNHTHTYPDKGATAVVFNYTNQNNPISQNINTGNNSTFSGGAHTHTITLNPAASTHTHTLIGTGDAETRPANISVTWAIKASN